MSRIFEVLRLGALCLLDVAFFLDLVYQCTMPNPAHPPAMAPIQSRGLVRDPPRD